MSTNTPYLRNYADMDGDGTADGIIFADLAVGGTGSWGIDGQYINYSYAAETGLKEYYVEEESYKDTRFGNVEGKLIAPKKGTNGKDRFYIMALEDINPGTRYCWYYDATGRLDKTIEYSVNDFGKGKENTEYVMKKWNNEDWGTQNINPYMDDIWGAIQTEVSKGWFVPSKTEWAVFGNFTTGLGITTSNYSNYGLQKDYWSSSQFNAYSAYYAGFLLGYVFNNNVSNYAYLRLCATF